MPVRGPAERGATQERTGSAPRRMPWPPRSLDSSSASASYVDYSQHRPFNRECDAESVDDQSTYARHCGMPDYLQIFGENVRSARKALGLSQESLALEVELDRTYISGIERARRNPSLAVIVSLARRLGTTPAALLTPPSKGGP